jgi:hypothetical protein
MSFGIFRYFWIAKRSKEDARYEVAINKTLGRPIVTHTLLALTINCAKGQKYW